MNSRFRTAPSLMAMAMGAYGTANRNYSWKMSGWKFIVLDVFGGGRKLGRKH